MVAGCTALAALWLLAVGESTAQATTGSEDAGSRVGEEWEWDSSYRITAVSTRAGSLVWRKTGDAVHNPDRPRRPVRRPASAPRARTTPLLLERLGLRLKKVHNG